MICKNEDAPKVRVIESILFLTNNLISRFDIAEHSEDFLNKKVSKANTKHFNKYILSCRSHLNELCFITAGMNYKFSRVIADALQKLDDGGRIINSSGGDNRSLFSLIDEETKRILGAIKRLQKDSSGYKLIVKKERHDFDETLFLRLLDSIRINQSINVFFNELNGGDIAFTLQQKLKSEKDFNINLYGIDRDINKGIESKAKGIHSARGGLLQVSRGWADIGFCASTYFPFYQKQTEQVSELISFYKLNVVRPGGLIIFNYPFYRINEIKTILETNKLVAVLNAKDKLGNLLFVIRFDSGESTPKEYLEQIEHSPSSFQSELESIIEYQNDGLLSVEKFRAKHIDLHDMLSELAEEEESTQFLIDCFAPQNKSKQTQNPLIEYKPGHIPAIATSEVLNGRYVDEILEIKTGDSFQFDHLFATKIVKREKEEVEEQTDKDGNPITLVKHRKNNYIISTALTAQGEYIELFSTEKVSDEEDAEL